MGKIVRRVISGYEPVTEWSPDDPASVEAAQRVLADEIDAGYNAVVAGHNDPVRELPADADTVILTMAMGGG